MSSLTRLKTMKRMGISLRVFAITALVLTMFVFTIHPGTADGPGFPVVLSPEIKVTKTVILIRAPGGVARKQGDADTLWYTTVASNLGNAAANGVTLSDIPDIKTNLVAGSVTASQGSISKGTFPGDKSVEVSLGVIPPGGAAMVTFGVAITDSLAEQQITNQAIVKGANFSDVLSDDPSTPQSGDATVINVQLSPSIPGVTVWGIMAMVLLLGGMIVWLTRKRQIRSETH